MSPPKLRKKRNGAGVLLLNRIRIRSRTTTPRQNPRPVQPPLAPLMSPPPPVLAPTTTTADDPTARNPGQLKSASKVGGEKPMIEIGGKEKQTTIVEDEEDEWTGCVFEDDTPLNPLEIHLAPVDDVVLVTQPEEDGSEEKEDAYEDMGEDEDKSGDEAKDTVKNGKEYRAIGPQR